MSRQCDNCGKKTVFGNQVSHSNRKTRRVWLPNLISIKTLVNNRLVKKKLCAKCLKKGKIQKVV